MRARTLSKSKILIPVLALGLVAGCDAPTGPSEVRSDKTRLDVSHVPASEINELARGNTAFALDLYRLLAKEPGNHIFSPYSISLALAMTYGGARGDTERQMSQVLRFPLPQDPLHPRFNALDQALMSRGRGQSGADGGPFRLRLANSLWAQQGYFFLPAFLDLLAQHYGAGLNVLDFAQAPEEARLVINNWVEKQTEERIKDLLPPGSIKDSTRLVLTNAVYFNAAWAKPFNKDATRPSAFHLLDGSEVMVPMMAGRVRAPTAEVNGVQAIELPYQGEEVGLLVLLPPQGRLTELETQLDAGLLDSIVSRLALTDTRVELPRFEINSAFSLKEALSSLGMRDLFRPGGADLSGINGRRDLFVSDVVHKGFIKVTEAGTEASGATGVIIGVVSAPANTLVVDRPFLYAVRDRATGSILFLGRVVDPR
ncbi:MAG: serpin family protein [Myxococcales bacterium]|nr:serpin family protein [Myxococcota bacterium]MDW8282087.1 serpin family protein [Myxococcales bacterium]